MNIAHQLLDGEYVLKRYEKKILKSVPNIKSIEKIEIDPHKNHIWDTTYHVVIEYKTFVKDAGGKEQIIPIFCSAHSSEPRRNVFIGLKFLWNNGFGEGELIVPRPLFYSKHFRGTFYVGVAGKNLYHYIKEKDFEKIEQIVKKAALWFARLHGVSAQRMKNFNKDNSRIQTVKPGMKFMFEKIEQSHPEFHNLYKKAYEITNKNEKKYLASTDKRWLVHGDAHPENVISMADGKIAVIDFTDLCLSDFARDIGTFLQQLEYKYYRQTGDEKYSAKLRSAFLDSYLNSAKISLDISLEQRIFNYYNWTALRTVAYLLLNHNSNPVNARYLLDKVSNNLNLCS